ncbi:MAG: methionine biosynthesis protein MetW [Gammaproteobacteria bacterium]|nr:methionine biosynthesis protein MetW [Gammaproteobacteria bacterium]MEE2693189.1 methionine biosynthesis protein MetW [Pseudomonadota bacterium]|tara:strand:+ start:741 stop:1340 length:600 start_codon:yes stop_codon:yes gene_type:complete
MDRKDFKFISGWIEKDSTVLDLGCGDSTLLNFLRKNKNVKGYGFEKDIKKVQESISKNISVIQADFNSGLEKYFDKNFFDYAVMTQALQENKNPDKIIIEMLRVAKEGIVTFPNMGFWKNRLQLGLLGKMPMSDSLPNNWFDTPNIHLCTFKDFEKLCDDLKITIIEKMVLNSNYESNKLLSLFPNLFGEIALYRFCKK